MYASIAKRGIFCCSVLKLILIFLFLNPNSAWIARSNIKPLDATKLHDDQKGNLCSIYIYDYIVSRACGIDVYFVTSHSLQKRLANCSMLLMAYNNSCKSTRKTLPILIFLTEAFCLSL